MNDEVFGCVDDLTVGVVFVEAPVLPEVPLDVVPIIGGQFREECYQVVPLWLLLEIGKRKLGAGLGEEQHLQCLLHAAVESDHERPSLYGHVVR